MVCVGLLIMFCHASAATPASAEFCQIYHPVHWSSSDTRFTKEQTDKNNRKWKALCRGAK